MAFQTLYPYQNRSLAMKNQKTSKDQQMDFTQLSCLLIANMFVGEHLQLGDRVVTVTSIDDETVNFDDGVIIKASELSVHSITQTLAKLLPTLAPAYESPLVFILERDPAVFRLRTQTGWVINDALCLMSGNIQYKKTLSDETVDSPEPESNIKQVSTECVATEIVDTVHLQLDKRARKKNVNENQISLF